MRRLVILGLFAAFLAQADGAWSQPEGQGGASHAITVIKGSSAASIDASSVGHPTIPAPTYAPLDRLSVLGDRAPQCRSQCASVRYSCLEQDPDSGQCDVRWNRWAIDG